MVRRTARCRPIDTFKSECRKIELVNKDLNHTDRVVLGDVVIQAFRQQRDLRSVLTLDESLHAPATKKPDSSV